MRVNDIQQKLREIQEASKLSQTALAREIGVSFPAFSAWWHGRAMPRKKVVLVIDSLFARYTAKRPLPPDELVRVRAQLAEYARTQLPVLPTILNRKDVLEDLIARVTYHSDAIEGSTLTLKETVAVLFDGADIKHRTVLEQMGARNHKAAILFLLDYLRAGNTVDEALVSRLHAILMNGILDSAGSYRFHGVRIAGTSVVTANYVKVPELMGDLFRRVASYRGEEYIQHVARVHADFEKIHPFADGNGRVGRLLLFAMLLERNLPPALIEQNLKHLYYTYLEAAQEKGDYSFIELFIAQAVVKGYAFFTERMTAHTSGG